MTFFRFAAPQAGQSYDYPTLGFFAVDGAVLDGTASNPQITAVPDAHWTVVASGPESGITRYRQPQTPPDDQSSWDGSLLVYDATARAFVRKMPSDAIASTTGLGEALAAAYAALPGGSVSAAQAVNLYYQSGSKVAGWTTPSDIIARTLSWVIPTDVQYGAKADGVTDDYPALSSALATGNPIWLKPGATFLISGGLNFAAGQRFRGNGATLKRAAQVSTTTTTTITSGSTNQITVADASKFRVGQQIALVNGSTFDTSNRTISAISGNTITVSTTFGISASGTSTVYLSFETLTLNGDGLVDDVKIDGNKANWTFYRWQNTVEVMVNGDRNLVRGVYANNVPGEGVMVGGNRNVVRDSWLTNLNGNGVHLTGATHPVCDNVSVINANLDTSVGHADGCIIWSNTVSDATITNCYMENGISGIGSIDSADNSDVTIVGNTIRNCTSYTIDMVCPDTNPSRVLIIGNRFYGSKPVTISNTNSSPTVFPGHVIMQGNYFDNGVAAQLTRVKKVSLIGNHFGWAGVTGASPWAIASCVSVTARDNIVEGGQYGVVPSANTSLILSGNQFINQYTGAINMSDASTSALIAQNFITNDATASASYNGIICRDRHVVQGNYIELTQGRSGIYAQNNSIVKDNTVRGGTATYTIRADGGTTGIQFKDNQVTAAISNAGGASNTETGTIVVP